jgi:hypothetical protein
MVEGDAGKTHVEEPQRGRLNLNKESSSTTYRSKALLLMASGDERTDPQFVPHLQLVAGNKSAF